MVAIPDAWITIRERMDALRLDHTREAAWELGARVRERWRSMNGDLPRKSLRAKSCGGGTHCFAVYPPEFIPVIDQEIEKMRLSDDAQGRLF